MEEWVPTRRVSKQEIEEGRTQRGGWRKATLASWGVPWPPPKGWRKYLTSFTEKEKD